MWDWIVQILLEILKVIQWFAADWGLSIIILVIIVRLLLTPLMLIHQGNRPYAGSAAQADGDPGALR